MVQAAKAPCRARPTDMPARVAAHRWSEALMQAFLMDVAGSVEAINTVGMGTAVMHPNVTLQVTSFAEAQAVSGGYATIVRSIFVTNANLRFSEQWRGSQAHVRTREELDAVLAAFS